MAIYLRYIGKKNPHVDTRLTNMTWTPGEVQVVADDAVALRAIMDHPDVFERVEDPPPVAEAPKKEAKKDAGGLGGNPVEHTIVGPGGEEVRLADATKAVMRHYLDATFGIRTTQAQSVEELQGSIMRLQAALVTIANEGAQMALVKPKGTESDNKVTQIKPEGTDADTPNDGDAAADKERTNKPRGGRGRRGKAEDPPVH